MSKSDKEEVKPVPLDEQDINLMKRYGMGPYAELIKKTEEDNRNQLTKINKMVGIKESDTGLSLPSQWDLRGDEKLAQVT